MIIILILNESEVWAGYRCHSLSPTVASSGFGTSTVSVRLGEVLYRRWVDLELIANRWSLNEARTAFAQEVFQTEQAIGGTSLLPAKASRSLAEHLSQLKVIQFRLETHRPGFDSALIRDYFVQARAHTAELLVALKSRGAPRMNIKVRELVAILPRGASAQARRQTSIRQESEAEIDVFDPLNLSWLEVKDWRSYQPESTRKLLIQVARHQKIVQALNAAGATVSYAVVFTGAKPPEELVETLASLKVQLKWQPIQQQLH